MQVVLGLLDNISSHVGKLAPFKIHAKLGVFACNEPIGCTDSYQWMTEKASSDRVFPTISKQIYRFKIR